jgi:glycosyltransferase involved in cell wall biosynthesis/peptidoglycan/xylan/chitin deacetylase (PgdA/CDA1 family)
MIEAASVNSGSMADVSVIIIFLNGEKFIREAIDSVFSQTFQHWELLLVDDGSTDSSTETARRCASSHPGKVRYLEHEGHRNLGPSAARNLGVRNAKGEFAAFLDCDDIWLPQKLERQLAILKSHPDAGMVFGASEYWRSWMDHEGTTQPDSIPDLGIPGDTLFQPPDLVYLLHPLGEGTAPCPSDLLVRRRIIERIGGFEEEFRGVYRVYEDQAFLAKVYLHACVFVSGESWTRYRIHPDSCMSTFQVAGHFPAARLFFLDFLKRYLETERVQDVRIWTRLRKALRQSGRSISIDGLKDADTRELKWRLRVTGGNNARLVFPSEDLALVRIAISKAGTRDPWDIQMNQADLGVRNGQYYKIDFRARADSPRTVNLGFSMAHDPWHSLGLYRKLELTEEWQAHSLEFAATADDDNARIHFDLGGQEIGVDLSAVIMRSLADGRLVEPDFVVQGFYPAGRFAEVKNPVRENNEPDDEKRSAPRFSVIIPTFQRRKLVLQAVRALSGQEFDGDFEVIVVVDGSRDKSAEALRDMQVPFPLMVVEQSNHGAAAARNRGASAARGEILLFLDDDMEAHPRLLIEHHHSHSGGADVVIGHIPVHPEAPANFLSAGLKWWAEDRARRLSKPGSDLNLHDLISGQFSVRGEVFRRLRGFDTDFTRGGTFGHEDLELGSRFVSSGCRIVFNPYALSYQNYVVTPRHYIRQMRQAGGASVTFARKHPDQAGVIFEDHVPGKATRAGVWRALAALRPPSTLVMAALRSLALALVDHGLEGPRATRFFFAICEMEFWRGVREAGGMRRLASVRVLAYHAIRDLTGEPVLDQYGTPPGRFRRQIQALKRSGFHFISAEQFLDFLHGGGPLPRLSVLLTFDDCYSDLLEHALPILRELSIPAVAFAVSGKLGGLNTWDTTNGAPPLRLLDVEGLRRLAAGGVEIGAHSRTHCPLTQASPEELNDEVAGCVEELEANGLKRPRLFAYPGGEWNPLVRRAVRAAGLSGAFTTDYGRAHEGHDAYAIPRIEIFRRDTGWKFLWKVIGAR